MYFHTGNDTCPLNSFSPSPHVVSNFPLLTDDCVSSYWWCIYFILLIFIFLLTFIIHFLSSPFWRIYSNNNQSPIHLSSLLRDILFIEAYSPLCLLLGDIQPSLIEGHSTCPYWGTFNLPLLGDILLALIEGHLTCPYWGIFYLWGPIWGLKITWVS